MGACVVCRRREPASGSVCTADRDRIARQLAELPRQLAALELHLVPGPAAGGERVSTSRGGSPSPARLDALSLAGPGTVSVSGMLHPLVRRWSTTRQVVVGQILTPGREAQVTVRTITEWHQELARDDNGNVLMVAADDQIGTLPPRELLGSWVRAWREHFRHAQATPTRREPGQAISRDAAARQILARQILGLDTHTRRDSLIDEWETRFGEPTPGEACSHDVAYLLTWLDHACDEDVGVGDLAAELRALSAELTRVLGEQPDEQWLGRCPAAITDVGTATTRPCGAGLWQDPHCSQVVCPRCHAAWGPRPTEILSLAYEIRRAWPIDRRRRYHADDVDALRPPRCPTCGQDTAITWRNVTATTDDRMWWRPDRAVCPTGCPDAERLI